jgi:flagellar hook protein FlgE
MPNFSIPLSGLAATDTALATISNNLANLNTTGYKDSSVNFQDVFYNLLGTNGSGDQLQLGGGTSVASISTNFAGGTTSSTGVDTDVAITGNGFFIVQDGSNTYYTRAGDFTRDASGNLVTADGDNVMGYTAVNGVVNTNGGLSPIQVQDGMVNPPKTTTTITMQSNLSSDDTAASFSMTVPLVDSVGTFHTMTVTYTRSANGWDYSATIPTSDITAGATGNTVVASGSGATTLTTDAFGTLASSTDTINPTFPTLLSGGTITATSAAITPSSVQSSLTAAETASTSSFNATVPIYDSLGTSHQLSVAYTRTTTGWNYNVTVPSDEITGGTGTSTSVASGSLTFNASGTLTSTAPIPITITGFADGASTLNMNWDLTSSSGTGLITQVSGDSSTGTINQDGYSSGTLTDFTVSADGTVMGTFTNGTKVLGQIALANFSNLQGLTKQGNNNYAATISSGSPVVGVPGTSSLGTLTGKSLELSNVDMSTEFSNLIVAERGFQANAKSVTTFDQIAQDTINLIR